MPSAAQFISFFQAVGILGSGLTALKLFQSGLYRRYRIFFAYFVFRVPYMIASLIVRTRDGIESNSYFYLFIYSQPLLLLAYVLVVMELYSLVLERYKGLYTLGRWAMYGATVVSATVSFLLLLPKIAASMPDDSKKLFYELGVERGVDLALVIFILLIVWFLSKYPVPLSRNVVIHTAIYSVFFLSDALVLLWRTMLGRNVESFFNVLAVAISSICSVAWWLMLTAEGEEVKAQSPQLRPESEERIMQQLDLINATLLKVAKK